MEDIATATDSDSTTEELTTESVATSTDGVAYIENNYGINDMYVLHFALILFLFALLSRNMFRKMYINLLGGRKGE